jgi:hypothetical protein
VFNRGPENIRDFLKQYQWINIGHLIVKDTLDVNLKWSWRKGEWPQDKVTTPILEEAFPWQVYL